MGIAVGSDIVFRVRWVLRRMFGTDLDEVIGIAQDFQQIVFEQRDRNARLLDLVAQQQSDIIHLKLEHARCIRSLLTEFLRVQENGTDVTDLLIAALRDFDDEVARLEEHAPA